MTPEELKDIAKVANAMSMKRRQLQDEISTAFWTQCNEEGPEFPVRLETAIASRGTKVEDDGTEENNLTIMILMLATYALNDLAIRAIDEAFVEVEKRA